MLTAFTNGFMDLAFAAESVAQITQAFVTSVAQFGFDNLIAIDMADNVDPFQARFLLATPDAKKQFSALNRRGQFHELAGIRYAVENDQPCSLEDLRQKSGMEQPAWEESRPKCLTGQRGVVLPVHRDGELKLYVGCAGSEPNTSAPVRAALHTCAHIAYDRIKLIGELRDQQSALTKREAECLYWVSKGKTDAEVGEILKIAPRTVRFHIGNAKQKLSADTRIQAIARKAIR